MGEKLGVTGKQVSNYESGALIPPMEILFKLCEMFECELGFLLDEESYADGTKFMTAINEKIGLIPESVNTLKRATGMARGPLCFKVEPDRARKVLNQFLSSDKFLFLLENLFELDRLVEEKNDIYSKLEEKYAPELLNQAWEIYLNRSFYLNDPDNNVSDDRIIEIIKDIEHSNGSKREYEHDYDYEKRIRYELYESFSYLINSIYPKL